MAPADEQLQAELQDVMTAVDVDEGLSLEQFEKMLTEEGAYDILKSAKKTKQDEEQKSSCELGFNMGLLYAITVSTSLLFSGIVFGWAPMLIILTDEKMFNSLCDSDGACDKQSTALSQIYSVSAVSYCFSGLPLGMLLDKFGKQFMCVLSFLLTALGFFLFGCANGPLSIGQADSQAVITIGYVLIGLGGMSYLLLAFKMPAKLPPS